jgi:hypothetical protein
MTRSSASSMAVFILAVALAPGISAGATMDKVCHTPPQTHPVRQLLLSAPFHNID